MWRCRTFVFLFLGAALGAGLAALGQGLSPKELARRIGEDYSLTREALYQELTQSVRDVTPAEFNQWLADGWFDERQIGGQERFLDVSVSNLFFRHPELRKRRLDAKNDIAEQRGRLAVARAITKAAEETGSPYVLPHRFENTMTLTVDADAAPPGDILRAWLPVPREYPYQNDFSLVTNWPAIKDLAPSDSPIRSAYFEEPAAAGAPTVFQITYDYTVFGVHFALDSDRVHTANLNDPKLRRFTEEAPHVVFSDKIKALARDLSAGSTNPMTQAKAFYDWIGTNIQYSFAREYSTLANISDYCLTHRYGDCGEEALLFITLCRSAGIPARWQTGWDTYPGFKDIHDWTEIYLAPYGWVPVDPWAGIFAMQECDALIPAERQELHDFYFGGLDFYRMAANSDHSQALRPPKKFPRSDDVDFQRGEVESSARNIYFDQRKTRWEVKELHEGR